MLDRESKADVDRQQLLFKSESEENSHSIASFVNYAFKYEIKCKLKARNSSYSVQTLLSSRLLSKNLKFKIYKTTLPVELYEFKVWSHTLREEFRLRVFENKILRRIIGSKRDTNGEGRRLHNEELLYRSHVIVRVIKSRRLRSAGHVARMEESRSAFKTLTGTPIGNILLGRPRRR